VPTGEGHSTGQMDRLIRNAGRKTGGKKGRKFEFELAVGCASELPAGCRFVLVSWQRGPKVACTRAVQVVGDAALFNEPLTILATLFLGKDGRYDAKDSRIVVREANLGPGGSKVGRALAEASLDLAEYAAVPLEEEDGVREVDVALELREPNKASPGQGRRLATRLDVRVTSTALFGPAGNSDGGHNLDGRSDFDFSEAGSAVSFGTSISEEIPVAPPPRPDPTLRWTPGATSLAQANSLYALELVNTGKAGDLCMHPEEQDLGGLESEPSHALEDEGGPADGTPFDEVHPAAVSWMPRQINAGSRSLARHSASAPVSPAGSPHRDRAPSAQFPALPPRLAALNLQTPSPPPANPSNHSQQTSPRSEEGAPLIRARSTDDLRAGVTQLQRRLGELEFALASARVELAQADYDKYEVALELQKCRRELKRGKERNVLLARQLTSLEVSASKKSSRSRKRAGPFKL